MGMMWVKCLSMMVATSRKSIKNNQEKKSTDVVSIRWPQRLSTLAGVGPLQTPNSVVEQGALKTGGLEDKALSQTDSLAPKSALDGRPILQSSTGWQVCTRRIWQVFDLIKSLPFLACGWPPPLCRLCTRWADPSGLSGPDGPTLSEEKPWLHPVQTCPNRAKPRVPHRSSKWSGVEQSLGF